MSQSMLNTCTENANDLGHSLTVCVCVRMCVAAHGWAWSVGGTLGDSHACPLSITGRDPAQTLWGGLSPHAPWSLAFRPHLSILWGVAIPKCAGHHQHQCLMLKGHHVILIHAQDLWVRRQMSSLPGPPHSGPFWEGKTQAPTRSLTPCGSPGSPWALTCDPLLSSRSHREVQVDPAQPFPSPGSSGPSPTLGSKAFRKSLPSCCA